MQAATCGSAHALLTTTRVQNVTLGGTGKEIGDRHPKVGNHALIGCGASVLGNINIGVGAQIAAGSLVLKTVEPHTLVAGSPAQYVRDVSGNPATLLQQWLQPADAQAAADGPQQRVTVTGLEVQTYQRADGERQLDAESMLFGGGGSVDRGDRDAAARAQAAPEPAGKKPEGAVAGNQPVGAVKGNRAVGAGVEAAAWRKLAGSADRLAASLSAAKAAEAASNGRRHADAAAPSSAASDSGQMSGNESDAAGPPEQRAPAYLTAGSRALSERERKAVHEQQEAALAAAVRSGREDDALQYGGEDAWGGDERVAAGAHTSRDSEGELRYGGDGDTDGDAARGAPRRAREREAVAATTSDQEAERLWGERHAEPEFFI